MSVRYRPMQPKDIRKCVDAISAHPILGPRYGKLIVDLPSAIRRALGYDTGFKVFEEFEGSTSRFLGAGLAVFVCENFLHEAKTIPYFWIGPELVKRITQGKSPLLSGAEVRDANSTSGLNLLVWHNSCHPKDFTRAYVGMTIMTAFVETYRGFCLREVFSQADGPAQLIGAQEAGGFYFDRLKGCYGDFPKVDASSFSDEPRNFGITRDLASTRGGSWVGSLFAYVPPQFVFSQGEQRLLLSALNGGGTDKELSDNLGVSLSAIKQTWRSIYDRVAACSPHLVSGDSAADRQANRGKQKRHRLLAYLREHPEELRPVSRKLLQQRWTIASTAVREISRATHAVGITRCTVSPPRGDAH